MSSGLIATPVVAAALIAASAGLGAAAFAFAAALINARVARQNAVLQALIAQRMKRAEFRQAWIADLRDAFTKMHVAMMMQSVDRDGAENSMRALLLMNRDDPDYERLRSATHSMLSASTNDSQAVQEARRDFMIIAQDILKREWEVTKREINLLEKDVRALEKPAKT